MSCFKVGVFLFLWSAWSQGATFFQNSKFQELALEALIQQRCLFYFSKYDRDLADHLLTQSECKKTSRAFLKYLSMSFIPLEDQQVARVTHLSDLQSLLARPQVETYLRQLQNSLGNIQNQIFDFYTLTQTWAGSKSEAILWIGLLFQDISESQIPIRALYQLESRGKIQLNSLQRRNLELLQQDCTLLFSLISSYSLGKDFWLYPLSSFPGQDQLRPVFYHFYTIALLTSLMKNESLPREKVFFAGFIFNYLYEGFKQIGPAIALREADRLPRSSLQDVYMGYRGALWGADLEGQIQPMTFESLVKHPFSQWLSRVLEPYSETEVSGTSSPF